MLDWGIGGLGCYRALSALCPDLPVLYWSDTGVEPYGKLSSARLAARVSAVLAALVARGATHVVVACNAASTVLPDSACQVPALGVIEAAISMVPRELTGTLGVLGGARTVRSRVYQRALGRPDLRVIGRVAQPLSAHVEAGTTHTRRFAEDVAHVMAPLLDANAILLACTHYPAVREAFRAHAPEAALLDPAEALARLVRERFAASAEPGPSRFMTTGDPDAMRRAAARAWSLELSEVERLALA